MLRERRQQLPGSSEVAGRLARVLRDTDRHEEALSAADDAVSHACGPRLARYLRLKAELLGKLGRHREQVEVLDKEVDALKDLPPALRDSSEIRAAEARLAEARQRLEQDTSK